MSISDELLLAKLLQTSSEGTVIIADSNTMIEGDVVPVLSDEQLVQAYNAVISGKCCRVVDALGMITLTVNQANSINDEISLYVIYFDRLILCYKEGKQITYKKL